MSKSDKGSNRLGSSIQLGANIENLRYKNQAALPNQHENDAQLFADIGKSFSAPGDRPRGVWRNFGAGVAKGLEYGAKSNSIAKKEDEFGEYANVMNYFQEVNNSAIEQNQWYENREKQLETIKPFAIGGLEVSYSGMDYGTGNERMRNIMEQAKIADPSIKGDYVGYVPNTPIVNMRDADGNITAFSLSSIVGEDVVKRVQGNYVDQQKLKSDTNYKQTDLDIKKYKEGIPGGAYGVKGGGLEGESTVNIGGVDYESIPLDSLEKSAKTDYEKKVNSSLAQVPINNQAIETIQGMKDIYYKIPDIGSSLIHLLDTEDLNSWGNIIARKFTSPEKLAAMEKLKKMASDLNLSTILGVPGKSATDLLKQEIKKAAPHGILTKEGFFDIAGKWEKRAYEKNQMAIAQVKGIRQGRMIIPESLAPQGMPGEPKEPKASNDNTDLSDMGVRVG